MSAATLLPSLTRDEQIPSLVERLHAGATLQVLADEVGLTKEGLRKRIKVWCYTYSGDNALYNELITHSLGERLVEAEDVLDEAKSGDQVAITHARENLSHVRWILERRCSRLFSPKQQIQQDTTIKVVYVDPTPQPVVEAPVVIEAVNVSAQLLTDQQSDAPGGPTTGSDGQS